MFLDTPRYNAGATGLDALWAGAPVLTLPGDRLVRRMGLSMLTSLATPIGGGDDGDEADANAILPALVAHGGWKAYEDAAVALAAGAARGARAVRRSLERARGRGRLFDEPGFMRAYERLLQSVWEATQVVRSEEAGGRLWHVIQTDRTRAREPRPRRSKGT